MVPKIESVEQKFRLRALSTTGSGIGLEVTDSAFTQPVLTSCFSLRSL